MIVPTVLGVDDKRLDEILADGIQGQSLEDNKVIEIHHSYAKRIKRHKFLNSVQLLLLT